MHPVIVASSILSASILAAAFGPRLLPARVAEAAPSAQMCNGHVGYYSPGLEQLRLYDNALDAFQDEIVAGEINAGNDIQVLDFEEVGGRVYFFYSTGC
ncbi:MAG: hypothetical protein ACKOWF_17850 [Chloroflexota bacterium]